MACGITTTPTVRPDFRSANAGLPKDEKKLFCLLKELFERIIHKNTINL
jgi:hypothetical protein